MTLAEKIVNHLKVLPEPQQAEVLDFIRFLEAKATSRAPRQEDNDWANLSLSQAMRDMEGEPAVYSMDDLREVFS